MAFGKATGLCTSGDFGICCFVLGLFLACASWTMLIMAYTTPWFCQGTIERHPHVVYGDECSKAWAAESASFYCVDNVNKSCEVIDGEFIPLLFSVCLVGGLCTICLLGQISWYCISGHYPLNQKAYQRNKRRPVNHRPFFIGPDNNNTPDPVI